MTSMTGTTPMANSEILVIFMGLLKGWLLDYNPPNDSSEHVPRAQESVVHGSARRTFTPNEGIDDALKRLHNWGLLMIRCSVVELVLCLQQIVAAHLVGVHCLVICD